MKSKHKIRVAILFGGRSTEHEVSLTSALSILQHIDREKYEVLPIKINKTGLWEAFGDSSSLNSYEALDVSEGFPVVIGDPRSKGFLRIDDVTSLKHEKSIEPVDVIFPVLHGTFGEDGAVQGLLSMTGIPFVGAGILASALGMDKIMMKEMFYQNDIPAVDFMWFLRKDWGRSKAEILKGVDDEIGYPCFVKPANTGSSVGVAKAHDADELPVCIDAAARYDRKIIVEKAVKGRELECAVLGNDDPATSVIGEVIPCHEFYDYEAKYVIEGSEIIIPADLPETKVEEIQGLARCAFQALDCAGMARVDFFLEKATDRVFINELNTIPGFTPISMYPKLWEASGISYSDLIDRLILLAFERQEDLNHSEFRRE